MTDKDLFIEWYKKRFEGLNITPPEEVWNTIEQDLGVSSWYKQEFEKLNVAPPEEVWQNIEQNLEVNNWYTKEFEKLNITPPTEVWDSISENLTISEAWKTIESSLAARQKRKIAIRRGSVASLLLLIVFASAYFLLNENKSFIGKKAVLYANSRTTSIIDIEKKTPSNFLVSKETIESAGSIGIQTEKQGNNTSYNTKKQTATGAFKPTGTASTPPKAENLTKSENRKEAPTILGIDTPKEYTPVSNNTNNNENHAVSEELWTAKILQLPIKSVSLVDVSPNLSITPCQLIADSAISYNKPDAGIHFKGIYAGGVYSFSNIWLLNNQTFNGYKPTSFDQTNFNSGNSYGVAVGYGLSSAWAAELNVYLNSHQGQTYHVYEEGRYLSKNISLNYSIFNLSIKQRKAGFTKFKKIQQSHGVIAGINYGYLKSAHNIYNERTEVVKDNYRLADFGLRLGYGYELLMFRKILLSTCLQTNIGLNNIYSGNEKMPGSFNRTHTAGIGAEVGIKYLLK